MKIYLTVLSVSVSVVLAACSGNEGNAEEVTPGGQATVPEFKTVDPKIIPLEDVQASQSGSVSQTIATTQMTITYDRPVLRTRDSLRSLRHGRVASTLRRPTDRGTRSWCSVG